MIWPRKLSSVLFSLTLIQLCAVCVMACSCMLDPDPPCRAAGNADAVFEAEVLRREKIETDTEGYFRRRFTMKVRKPYKGSLGEAVYVYTGNGDSDCGYRFKVGNRYLVYAYERDGRMTASTCTRTREISGADEDRKYFNGLSTMPPGASVFGKVIRTSRRDAELAREPFPEIKIEIEGAERRTVTTNSEGTFSVSGLKPGSYKVIGVMPDGFQLSYASRVDLYPYPWYVGEIPDKGCIEAHFVLEPKTKN